MAPSELAAGHAVNGDQCAIANELLGRLLADARLDAKAAKHFHRAHVEKRRARQRRAFFERSTEIDRILC
jgi:hypothetical protein